LGHRFLYTSGDLDVIPAGSVSRWTDDHTAVSLWLRFSPELLSGVAHELRLPPGRDQLELRYQFRDAQIQHIGAALEGECRVGFPNGRLYTETLGRALAVRLLHRSNVGAGSGQKLSRRRLQVVTHYIEDRLSTDLGLQELADVVGLSPSHFRTLFKQSTGVPVHAYVIRRRVERARALLVRRELPASQVALESGFAHQSHMARCMRRVLGLTPRALLRALT
jgi:AraC family transcriptional regulator